MGSMTNMCSGLLADALQTLNAGHGWRCTPVEGDRAVLSTGRRFADAEPVEIFVSARGDIVTLTDGGEIVSRLAIAGFDMDDEVLEALWRDALHEFRLGFHEGVVSSTTSPETIPFVAQRFADALVGLDTLRLVALPKKARSQTFADTVEDYLRSSVGDAAVRRAPSVTIGEITVRPTLQVLGKTGGIYVQAAATTSWNSAFEHAFWTFSLLDRMGTIPLEHRLIVLGGSESTWGRPRINMLADVAYVGLWSERSRIESFIRGIVPNERVLLT